MPGGGGYNATFERTPLRLYGLMPLATQSCGTENPTQLMEVERANRAIVPMKEGGDRSMGSMSSGPALVVEGAQGTEWESAIYRATWVADNLGDLVSSANT